MRMRLAVIGASTGQLPICLKAREMGVETYCFAWPEGAVCKDYADYFFPVSIMEMDEIVSLCRKHNIDGVVSNASDITACVAAYVAEKLGKVCTPYETMLDICRKDEVRKRTGGLSGLGKVRVMVGTYDALVREFPRPFVIKPVIGCAKKGVSLVGTDGSDIEIPEGMEQELFMAEEYIGGQEYSVESVSYQDEHTVVQVTEKVSTGAPHFVELAHHQPASLSPELYGRIKRLVPEILNATGFRNGASHLEIKVDGGEKIYLIELNPRGGGDFISDTLVGLSTDFDYIKAMIEVALGIYTPVEIRNKACAGVYFLTAYTAGLLEYFDGPAEEWMVSRKRDDAELRYSSSNYDRNGSLVYCSDKKIVLRRRPS